MPLLLQIIALKMFPGQSPSRRPPSSVPSGQQQSRPGVTQGTGTTWPQTPPSLPSGQAAGGGRCSTHPSVGLRRARLHETFQPQDTGLMWELDQETVMQVPLTQRPAEEVDR